MSCRTSMLICLLLATALLCGASRCAAQYGSVPTIILQQPIGQPVGGGLNNESTLTPLQAERMSRWANAERQKQLIKDSVRLVALTRQFKERMAAAGNARPTEADLKLIAQIEKLAHSIRNEMAYAGSEPPLPHPQPNIW